MVIQAGKVRNSVDTFAVRPIRAISSASGTGRRFVQWPIWVAYHGVARPSKCRRNVIFSSVSFGLVVNARQIGVGGLAILAIAIHFFLLILLKPEAEFHVIAEQLGSDLLVSIQHDSLVVTAVQST